MEKVKIAQWAKLEDRKPSHALVAKVDLVIVRYGDDVSVLYGRCQHRGALMADGFVRGNEPRRSSRLAGVPSDGRAGARS